jgi:hypothetical protein
LSYLGLKNTRDCSEGQNIQAKKQLRFEAGAAKACDEIYKTHKVSISAVLYFIEYAKV